MKKMVSLLLAALMVLSLVACGGNETPTGTTKATEATQDQTVPIVPTETDPTKTYKKNITVAAEAAFNSLDPGSTWACNCNAIYDLVFDRLVEYDFASGSYSLSLAKSIEYTDATCSKIHVVLRDDIFFSNGDPVTADDVIFSLERSTYSTLTGYLDHGEKVNDKELYLIMKNPLGSFIPALGVGYANIICKAAYEAKNDDTGLIGSGPYKYDFDSYVVSNSVKLVQNDKYWGEKPYVETIQVMMIPDANARAIALEQGEIDFAYNLAVTDLSRLEASGKLDVNTFASTSFIFLAWNNHQGSDVSESELNFRRAVACALNRDEVVAALGEPGAKPMVSFWNWETSAYIDDPSVFPTDLTFSKDKAKEYLAKTDKKSFDCLINSSKAFVKVAAQVLQEELRQVGITMNIEEADNTGITARTKYDVGDFEAYLDANMFTTRPTAGWPFFQPGGVNKAIVSDPTINAALDAIRMETDPAKMDEQLRIVQTQSNEQQYYLPIAWRMGSYAVTKGTANFELTPSGVRFFRNIMVPEN